MLLTNYKSIILIAFVFLINLNNTEPHTLLF